MKTTVGQVGPHVGSWPPVCPGSGGHPSLQDRLLARTESGLNSELEELGVCGRREADTWALQGSRLRGSPAGLSPSAGGGSSGPPGGPQPPARRALGHPSPQPGRSRRREAELLPLLIIFQ